MSAGRHLRLVTNHKFHSVPLQSVPPDTLQFLQSVPGTLCNSELFAFASAQKLGIKRQPPVPAVHFAVSAVHFAVSAVHFAVSVVHFAVSAVHFAVSAVHFAVSVVHVVVSDVHFSCV